MPAYELIDGYDGLGGKFADIERRLSDLERASSLPLSSIGSGGLTVKNGGEIRILASDGDELVILDSTGVRLNDGSENKLIDLTTGGLQAYETDGSVLLDLDGSRLRFNRSDGSRQLEVTAAGGLKIYASNGTTEQVVLDGDGLEVAGGVVTPLEPQRYASSTANESLTTTNADVLSLVVTPPSWAEEMRCQLFIFGQMSAGGTTQNLITVFQVGSESEFSQMEITVPANGTNAAVNYASITHGSAGISLPSSFTVKARARVNTGTNSLNQFRFTALVDFMRAT